MSVNGNSGQSKPNEQSMGEAAAVEQQANRDQNLTNYLYGTLYKQQLFSDVTVTLLGKEWKLHKVIVQQCPYFASMFSGNWKETKQEVIQIVTEDPAISIESAEAVFGSMYGGDVVLTSKNVLSILATASLFLMQELIDKCARTMIETIDKDNVMSYYNASETYGLPIVKSNVIQWLELNLISCSHVTGWKFMKNISPELMKNVISGQSFVVERSDNIIYRMLRKWLYLKLRKSGNHYKEFYENQTWDTPLLLTEAGKLYKSVFETTKIRHLLESTTFMQTLENDNIVPKDWIQSAYKEFWQYSINIRDNKDLGSTNVAEDVFEKECMKSCWIKKEIVEGSKSTFGKDDIFGLDFQFVCRQKGLKITRKRKGYQGCINVPETKRNIMLKVLLIAFDGKNNTRVIKRSGLLTLSVDLDEEVHVMDFGDDISFPLKMMIKTLTVTPQ